jgi:ADP-heptose:LPS heptosyltransferase
MHAQQVSTPQPNSASTASKSHPSRLRAWRRTILEQALSMLAQAIRPWTARQLDPSQVSNILVLQLQQLGDSVVFTPTLRALRRRFPQARLDMLANTVSFALYEKCPHVDRFYVDRSAKVANWAPRALVRILAEVRKEKYDVVVADVTQVSLRYALVALLTGARRRLGFDVDNRGFLYSTRLQRTPGDNFVDCNLTIAEAFGAPIDSREVEVFFDTQDERHAEQLLAKTPDYKPLIAIHPASNWQSKWWYPERWASVADTLSEQRDASIVFVGTKQERPYVENIIQLMRNPAQCFAGDTSLPQLAALLSKSALFIGTDSGPRHVAAGTGCLQVTLMSSLDRKERWQFNRAREIVIRTDPECSPCFLHYCAHRTCMARIDEHRVLQACSRLLGDDVMRSRSTDRARAGSGRQN